MLQKQRVVKGQIVYLFDNWADGRVNKSLTSHNKMKDVRLLSRVSRLFSNNFHHKERVDLSCKLGN